MRKGSKLAMIIERDMKIEQAFKRREREKCKEKKCIECKYRKICGRKNDT